MVAIGNSTRCSLMQYVVLVCVMCFLTTKCIRGTDTVLETVVSFDLRLTNLSDSHNKMSASLNVIDRLKKTCALKPEMNVISI